MNYKNEKTYQQALRLRNEAAWAFELAEYETAFELYIQAEELFRQSFPSHGDFVYFMQTWAIRCLDNLVKNDPNLLSLYQSKSEKFLAEWSEAEIRDHITPSHVPEALLFRSFIVPHLKAQPDYTSV